MKEKKNLDLEPSKHSEYLRPAARAVGLHVKTFHSFWSRQLSWQEKNTAPDCSKNRREECQKRGPGRWIKMVQDCLWLTLGSSRPHMFVLATAKSSGLRCRGGEKSHRSSCEKSRKATKWILGGGVCSLRSWLLISCRQERFDRRWFLNVSDWWKLALHSRCPLLARQGRMWRASPLLAGSRMNR